MNREIKFRVWAETDEGTEMIYLGKSECDNGLWFDAPKHLDKYEALMQYTGKTDKVGWPIYEGDIVQRTKLVLDLDQPDYDELVEEKQQSVIVWRGKGFWVEDEGFGFEGEDLWDWDEIEVIGNIYENPELLK